MAAKKNESELERLRILVSDGKGHRLEEVTHTVTSLGHEVVGHSSLGDVAATTASIRPDAAIVIVGESSEHALELIGRSVTEAACPVIAILDVEDEAFIRDAAKRGIFAYITLGRASSALQSSLDVVLSRFAEYQGLEGVRPPGDHGAGQGHPDGAALGRRPTGVRDAPRRGTPHEPQAHRGCGGGHTERPSPSQVARRVGSGARGRRPRQLLAFSNCLLPEVASKDVIGETRRSYGGPGVGDPWRCPGFRDSRRKRRTIGPPRRPLLDARSASTCGRSCRLAAAGTCVE